MTIVESKKATARVALASGNHVNYFDTLEGAEAYAADANKRAEEMGLEARYVAEAYAAE